MEQLATLHISEPIIQLPEELTTIVVNSGIDKAEQYAATFAPFMIAVKEFSNKAESLNKDQPGLLDAQIARQIRLAMVKNRSAADQAKDARKAGLLAESNLIQNLFNVVVNTSKLVEADLTAIEKHAELKEQDRQSAIKAERSLALAPYLSDPNIYPLGTMSEDAFETLLTGSRLALEQKQLAEQEAELERIRVENERLAEQERMKLENERLKKEAEERQQLQSIRLAAIRPYLTPGNTIDLGGLWQLPGPYFDNMVGELKGEFDKAVALREANELALKQAKEEADTRFDVRKGVLAELGFIDRGSDFQLPDTYSLYWEQVYNPTDEDFEAHIEDIKGVITRKEADRVKLAEIEESNRLASEKAKKMQDEKDEADRLEQDRLPAIGNRLKQRSDILHELGLEFNHETQNFFNLHLSIARSLVKYIDDATFETQLAGWKHHIEMAEKEMADILAKKKAEIEAAKAPERDRLKAWVESTTMPVITYETIAGEQVGNDIILKFNSFKTWALQQIEGL
ncbi:MAG: hypothetical protein V4560_14970 [Bacteroidota bacterium]